MVVIDQHIPEAPAAAPAPAPLDERAARATLRAQIARLERELGTTVAAAFPHVSPPAAAHADAVAAGPRLLDLGALERVRDDLAERVRRAHAAVAERAAFEARSRALLEEMLREPERHKGVRLPVADLGQPGCGAYRVQPRLGLVGRLMGWWHITLSSGCPRPAPA